MGDFHTLSCNKCFEAGGRSCILRAEFTYSVCCNPKDPSDFCETRQRELYCSTSEKLPDVELSGYVCPTSRIHCPSSMSEINIPLIEDQVVSRKFEWLDVSEDPSDWHCKYRVRPSDNMEYPGYTVVDVTMDNFTEYVYLML